MKIVLLVFTMLINISVNAQKVDFSHWLTEEVLSHQSVLEEIENDTMNGHVLTLNTLRVRVRATFTTKVPFIAKGKVRPEIELYFKK